MPTDGIFELRLSDELNNNDFPVMIQHGIDCHDVQTVHALLRELSKLNDSVSSRKLFTYDQSNGKHTSMVRVPTSTKYQWFVRNAPSWLPNVLDAVCPETDEENKGNGDEVDDRLGYGRKDAARWLLTYLGAKWPTEFAQAGGEIGMPVSAKTMGAYRAFAMWGDANITLAQQRIILRHLRQFFGQRIAVPESKIRELSAGVVNPKSATIKHNGKTLTYSYRDIDDLIGRFIADQFRTRKGFEYDSLDIVVGGDYGQGSFRSGIKLIFRKPGRNGRRCTKEIAVLMIGTIECQKDSYDILKVTLAPKLNDAFKRMLNYYNTGTSKMTDGAITTFKPVGGSTEEQAAGGEYYSTFQGERKRPSDVLVQNSPFRLFITGDLAFYATML